MLTRSRPRVKHQKKVRRRRRKAIHRLIENDLIRRVSYEEYRNKVRHVYGGPKGAMLATCSMISLHAPFGERLFRERKFDLRGVRNVLDVGSGAGQIAKHLIKYADQDARVTCFDLSPEMLVRARQRFNVRIPDFVAADMAQMPFADGSFDCVTCGYVLEHLPNPRTGLAEIARVLRPGGRMFLLTTEDSFSGAWTSRVWCCRTYNRHELLKTCESLRLHWKQELWFTRMHKVFRAGGICVEIEKR
ncbi:MAG: class I SAM-dependent methyltransferase [Pirellulales bacterium]